MAKVASIYIDGEIIPESWNWWGDDATSLMSVRNQITAAGEFDELEVFIFSPGGFCFEGWAIADYLQALGKPVTTIAYGQCASIATIIFAAGSVRKITPNTDFMIHLPWGGVDGNEHQVLAYYNELVIEGDKIAGRYAQITGGDKVAIKALLANDYHMTGSEAVAQKYATELLGAEPTALKARTRRNLSNPVAYLRRPKNVTLKAETQTENPIQIPIMVEPKATDLDRLLSGFTASMKNIFGGKPAKALDVNTESGQVIVIDVTGTDPAIGDKVTLKDTGAAAPDGDYTASAADKTVYTVAGGVITNITVPTADESTDTATDLATANARIKELEGQLTAAQAANTKAQEEMSNRLDLLTKALGGKQSKEVAVNADKGAGSEEQGMSAIERKRARDEAKKK